MVVEKEYFEIVEGNIVKKVLIPIQNLQKKKESIGLYMFIKRAFDIVASFFALIILSPVFLIVSLAVKLCDGGKVLFVHNRVGKDGKIIGVPKFRSMRENAEKVEDILTPEQLAIYRREYKLDNDPRLTKVGNIIRKFSIDELPQFYSILKGDMSFVGPRPLIEEEIKSNYSLSEERAILSVKPGLTGYWQAFARNNATYETGNRQKMELFYVENRSIEFDIKIILETVKRVVSADGAK